MEPQSRPAKIARFADFGIRLTSRSNSWNMESNGCDEREGSPPPVGLSLELGTGYGHKTESCDTKSCVFTIFQLQELHLQSLIFKYMEAGLPVPTHLVIPIWKSISNSFGDPNGFLRQLYPSFFGSGSLGMEYRNGMDPEPGRCRRTDGKKWRCSKEVVAESKYCEKHMHRGRQRSRKLVEASQVIPPPPMKTYAATTSLSISLPGNSCSSSSSGSIGFSPNSVVVRGTQKMEPSL